eukprot:365447-Chlamydomonas_euryale.AAC.7
MDAALVGAPHQQVARQQSRQPRRLLRNVQHVLVPHKLRRVAQVGVSVAPHKLRRVAQVGASVAPHKLRRVAQVGASVAPHKLRRVAQVGASVAPHKLRRVAQVGIPHLSSLNPGYPTAQQPSPWVPHSSAVFALGAPHLSSLRPGYPTPQQPSPWVPHTSAAFALGERNLVHASTQPALGHEHVHAPCAAASLHWHSQTVLFRSAQSQTRRGAVLTRPFPYAPLPPLRHSLIYSVAPRPPLRHSPIPSVAPCPLSVRHGAVLTSRCGTHDVMLRKFAYRRARQSNTSAHMAWWAAGGDGAGPGRRNSRPSV